jgi:hypothetical protein
MDFVEKQDRRLVAQLAMLARLRDGCPNVLHTGHHRR